MASEIRVVPLASGSAGNALVVQAGSTHVLIDAGLPLEHLEDRLAQAGFAPRQIDGLLLTHRHRDHIRGAADFIRQYRVRTLSTRRTLRSLSNQLHRRLHAINPGTPRSVGEVTVHAFRLSHDAPDTVGYRLAFGDARYGHVTDLGRVDDTVVEGLHRCQQLTIEFNHDRNRLLEGPYPPNLKRRIAGDWGHLDNDRAADLLATVTWPGLERVFLAHLSATNNTEDLALEAARRGLGGHDAELVVCRQHEPTLANSVRAVSSRRS